MALKIMPHGRLQERVAEEMGYFTAEGLECICGHGDGYGVHSVQREPASTIGVDNGPTEIAVCPKGPAGTPQ